MADDAAGAPAVRRMTTAVTSLARLFSQDKRIASDALNRMGAQVFRTVAARAVYNVRRVPVPAAIASEFETLRRDGIVVVRDFLTPAHFADVRREFEWLSRQHSAIVATRSGSATVEEIAVRRFDGCALPAIFSFFADARLRALIEAAEQRPFRSLVQSGEWETILHGESSGPCDPESDLHSDTFFNTHKAWLYVDDVGVANGPLAYLKGSHQLTCSRLAFVYRDSCGRRNTPNPSRRVSAEELRQLGRDETVVTCAANTLVIVNACGYHRRMSGAPGAMRRALHLSARANPFGPHRLHARIARHPGVYEPLRAAAARWRA
jgi:hypothetical protein